MFIALIVGLTVIIKKSPPSGLTADGSLIPLPENLDRLNRVIESRWQKEQVSPAPAADPYTLARRLSLSLTGAVPSLEEIRMLETTEEKVQLNAWLDHLLADRRTSDYLAERFARVYVGVESGPFLVYRRRRMVNWISDQIFQNRPYDDLARELIAAKGIWTTSPAGNFITVTTQEGAGKGTPDEIKLAARTSRAFLGVSLDCVQCHDDKFGDRWKQKDFHQLAAYFAQSDIGLSGVWDNPELDYETRYRGKKETEPVSMQVPYQDELVTSEVGTPRDQLANWITHRENKSFSRAIANRAWAMLFGRPLVTPIDDIPIDGDIDPVLEFLAEEFVNSDHDLHALFRLIANSNAFQRSSQSDDPERPITLEQEAQWAAFPLTQLRPEQVSNSIVQAASVKAIDSTSHIIQRLARAEQTKDFVNRFGDKGENEFIENTGTIPQRLILMNGNLVNERTQPNPVMNSTTRIAALARDPHTTIDSCFLSVLSRLPTEKESAHFSQLIAGKKGEQRQRVLQDIYWALINSTEFSWNR